MTGNEYQTNVLNWNVDYPESLGAFCSTLKMQEEMGRLASTLLKVLNKKDGSITNKERDIFAIQLGEILAYLVRTMYHCGLTMDYVMQLNLDINAQKEEYNRIDRNNIFKK